MKNNFSDDSMPSLPKDQISQELIRLVDIVTALRGPNGCPWDKEQTHDSLVPYAIEETAELVEAIESKNISHVREELGDVLFQVILHSQLAAEAQNFHIGEVAKDISDKLERRHPHVFGEVQVKDSAEVLKNWEVIKQQEKKAQQRKPSFGVPPQVPALQAAWKIGQKTKKSGFDWDNILGVLAKVREEILELEEAMDVLTKKHIEHEIGDVLFSIAQLARHLEIEPETALRKTNSRFERRYFTMLDLAQKEGLDWQSLSLDEKEGLWQRAKASLKGQD